MVAIAVASASASAVRNVSAALTPREREVLRRIGEGESTLEIALALRIAPATVRTHVRAVLLKLGVRSRAQAAAVVAPVRVPLARHTPFDTLTRRESEVLRCMAAGLPRVVIAERLAMSPNTVRTHARNVLAKLGVRSSLAACALLRRALATG